MTDLTDNIELDGRVCRAVRSEIQLPQQQDYPSDPPIVFTFYREVAMKTQDTKRMKVSLAAVVGCAMLLACTEENASMAGPNGSRSTTPASQTGDSVYAEERPFWDLAQELPSSAGFYIDTISGNVVVLFTNPKEAEGAKNHLRSRLAWALSAARQRNPQADIVLRQSQFTFLQLKRWRDLMNRAISFRGVSWLGPDEVKNRIVFGVSAGTSPGPIRALARSLGIPQEAIAFEISGPYVPQLTLRDSVRPLAGGTQLAFLDQSDNTVYDCTLGFPATWNGQRAFVTASHCSTTTFAADSTLMYQPKYPITHMDSINISPAGVKVFDYDVACPAGFRQTQCSNADAGIWKMTLDTTPANWVLGHIARPTSGCLPDPCNPPVLGIGSYFKVNATQASIAQGAVVSMIGRTSGWSQAFVQKVCQTVSLDNDHALLCQDFANYGSGDGDSGAPILMDIFLLPDSNVTLAGIHSGITTKGPKYGVFSPWSGIATNYPGLIVF